MQISKQFDNGMSFDEFIKTEDDESYRESGLEIFESISFDEEYIKEIKSIKEQINILVYAEVWCGDCMINIPVIEKMRSYNDNIKISIFNKDRKIKSGIKLEEHVKLPTFIVYDKNFNELGTFKEFPKKLKKIIESGNESNFLVNIRKYRKGNYAEETLKDILNIISRRS